MKKFIFLLLIVSSFSFGANLYFLNGGYGYIYTDNQTFPSGIGGYAQINYWLWADPVRYTLNNFGVSTKPPGGSWSDFGQGSNPQGLIRVLEEGTTWQIQGRAWVVADIWGGSNYWIYTQILTFTVEDNTPPPVPSGIGSITYNNHPKITWNSGGSALDRSGYSV